MLYLVDTYIWKSVFTCFFVFVSEPSLICVTGWTDCSYQEHASNCALGVNQELNELKHEVHEKDFLQASQMSGISLYTSVMSCN